jgi:hypothetical protein
MIQVHTELVKSTVVTRVSRPSRTATVNISRTADYYSSTAMKFYLFNLTDCTVFVKSECSRDPFKLAILPNLFAALPSDKHWHKFIVSSVGTGSSSTREKVSTELEIEWQYAVNTTEAFPFRWNLAMPEDCPWRIYRDQVASLAPL